MAGKIVADTLEHSTAGSIATNYVVEGSAKAWANLNGSTFGLRDDFNFASATDQGSGDYDFSFTNNMANANYAVSALGNASGFSNSHPHLDGALTSSTILIRTVNSAFARQDTDHVLLTVQGDLA